MDRSRVTRRDVLRGLLALPLVAVLPAPPVPLSPILALTVDAYAGPWMHHDTRRTYLALIAANRRYLATDGR